MITFPVTVTVSCDRCGAQHTNTYAVPDGHDYGVHLHAAAVAREHLGSIGWSFRSVDDGLAASTSVT